MIITWEDGDIHYLPFDWKVVGLKKNHKRPVSITFTPGEVATSTLTPDQIAKYLLTLQGAVQNGITNSNGKTNLWAQWN